MIKRFTILAAVFSIIAIIISVNESYGEIDNQECVFSADIEKSWIMFGERPWVTGFIVNCDDGIQYHLKDTVYVRILNINGDVIQDSWKPKKDTARTQHNNPSKYIFNDQVYRGGAQVNADVSKAETIHINKNQYFFYLPQIQELDFDHRGIYQIELTYNKQIKTIWFAVLDPDKWWQDE